MEEAVTITCYGALQLRHQICRSPMMLGRGFSLSLVSGRGAAAQLKPRSFRRRLRRSSAVVVGCHSRHWYFQFRRTTSSAILPAGSCWGSAADLQLGVCCCRC